MEGERDISPTCHTFTANPRKVVHSLHHLPQKSIKTMEGGRDIGSTCHTFTANPRKVVHSLHHLTQNSIKTMEGGHDARMAGEIAMDDMQDSSGRWAWRRDDR